MSGKAQSRKNSTKHGMAGQSAEVEAGFSDEFKERRAKWAVEQNPVGEAGNFALDRTIAATFRIERCEQTINEIITDTQQRATLAWEQDRAVEAAMIFGRLKRDPVLASRKLQATFAGVELLLEAWLGLGAVLESDSDWSEQECSIALDLLGVPTDLRSGLRMIDAPEATENAAYRLQLTCDQITQLKQFRDEALAPLEEMERRRAMAGHSALLSKPAKLALRYEREAWKHCTDSMKELKHQAPAASAVMVAPIQDPVVVEPPKVRERAEAPPIRSDVANQLVSTGQDDDPAWLDALDQRFDGMTQLPGSFVPIAVGARPSGG